MPRTVNLHEAKTQLSTLVEAAEHGEEIIIAKNGVAKARLAPIGAGAQAVRAACRQLYRRRLRRARVRRGTPARGGGEA
jgi:prevent-host-death family protein